MNKLSFKELIDKYTIEIPMIQRDYAYGRCEEREKRENFLINLKSYFNNSVAHELDFIYGSIDKNGKLILLDGQQRITTLFLLHWYLSLVKDNTGNHKFTQFQNIIIPDRKESRFTYKTRFSSTDFCNALVLLNTHENYGATKYSNLIEFTDKSISAVIKKGKWFLPNWNYDPTILSMLNMIDSIHQIFKPDECSEYFEQLIEGKSIVFNFLNLENFKLTDELYIKMNSRGRPLTRFENLKSKILKLYDNAKIDVPDIYNSKLNKINKDNVRHFSSLRDYVSLMFDTKWTDIFWNEWLNNKGTNETPPNVDIMMLNFISVMGIFEHIMFVMNGRLSINRHDEDISYVQYLMYSKNINKGSTIRYDDFIKLFKENDYSFLFNLIDYFNIFYETKGIKKYLPESFSLYNESEMFKIITDDHKNDLKYEDKAKLFAYIKYLFENPTPNTEHFVAWMKFICNVCNNSYTLHNYTDTFCNALAGIKYLYCENISQEIFSKNCQKVKTLDSWQIEEEILKIKLSENPKWKFAIDDAEKKLQYLEGDIGYVLYECVGLSNSSQVDNIQQLNSFNDYVNKMAAIFTSKNGCHKEIENDLIRALLSKGNYLRYFKGNHSLLRNAGRDNSWRRLLKKDDKKCFSYKFFKNLLDDVNFNLNHIKESLIKIASKRDNSIESWQKAIIDHPQILENIDNIFTLGSNRCLRWNDSPFSELYKLRKTLAKDKNECEIDLLKGERISGYHAEMFSMCKYIDIINAMPEWSSEYKITYCLTNTETQQPYFAIKECDKFILGVMYQCDNLFLFFSNDKDYIDLDNILKRDIPYDNVESEIKTYLSGLK